MSDLKPCPFCGKDPNQEAAKLGDRPCFYYECDNPKCRAAEMGWHDTEQEAIDAWNARPIEDALRKEIAQLQADNRSLVEQMNAQSEQIKLLNTALDIAAEDIDFSILGICPNEFEDYGCPFGECKFADGKPHENDCWKVAFIKAAKKHLRGEK